MEDQPTAPPAPAPAPWREDHVGNAFRALMKALAQRATDASDIGDEAGFQRAFAFRTAVGRMSDRWTAGEASPVRSATPKKEG